MPARAELRTQHQKNYKRFIHILKTNIVKIALFRISSADNAKGLEELNSFLASHMVLSVKHELVSNGAIPSWEFCIMYEERNKFAEKEGTRDATDYKEKLPPEQYRLFAAMRVSRNTICEDRNEPSFNMFTNKELASISQLGEVTENTVSQVIGKNRYKKWSKKYAQIFFDTYNKVLAERDERFAESEEEETQKASAAPKAPTDSKADSKADPAEVHVEAPAAPVVAPAAPATAPKAAPAAVAPSDAPKAAPATPPTFAPAAAPAAPVPAPAFPDADVDPTIPF